MIRHLNISIKGLVQGVFFRKYTIDKAQEFRINGFVMNMPDDSVCIEAEGEEEALSAFVEWCHKGSPASKVEGVDVKIADMMGYQGFEIRRSSC